MPRSKREKLITLAKTKKKGKALKQNLIENVREAVDAYSHLYVIQVHNERNNLMKELREKWSDSKFFFGKNKVMWKAFGRDANDEYVPGLSQITLKLRGKRGIFASNAEPEQVVKFFEEFCEPEFARAGGIADRDVELKAGILEGQPFAIEPTLRQLGLQTKLEKGNIVLIKDTFLCKKGDVLKSEQARLLKLFGEKTANFQVVVIGVWADGKYEKLIDGNDDEFPDHHKAGSKRKKSAVNESDDEDDSDEDEDEEDDEEEDDDSDLEEFEE